VAPVAPVGPVAPVLELQSISCSLLSQANGESIGLVVDFLFQKKSPSPGRPWPSVAVTSMIRMFPRSTSLTPSSLTHAFRPVHDVIAVYGLTLVPLGGAVSVSALAAK
jgi:hypothetical protein